MKIMRKIFIFFTISIIIQIIALFLLNNFYLVRNKAYIEAIKYVDLNGLKVSEAAKDFKVSFDGKYIGYLLNGKLKVFNMKNNQEFFLKETEDTISFFKWLPDRNLIIFAKKNTDKSQKNLQINTVDIISGEVKSYPQIESVSKESEVIRIELSPLTNMVYVVVKINQSDMDIYKYDIMDNLKYIMTVPVGTIIKEMNFKDILVYQKSLSTIIIRNGSNNFSQVITLKKNAILLGTDYEDNIYIGELDNEKKINKILIKKDNGDWTEILLKNSFVPEKIYISSNAGLVYLNDDYVYILNTDRKIKFSGLCKDILNNYVLVNNNNNLYVEKIESKIKK